MLRNRDSFFQTQTEMGMTFPNMNNIPNFNYPNFNYPNNYQQGMPNNLNINTNYNLEDYDNRIAKIERQINRLDARLTKVENANKIISDDISSSMYMV